MPLSIILPPPDLRQWSSGVASISMDAELGAYGFSRFPALVGSHLAVIMQGAIELWEPRSERWIQLSGAFLTGPQTRPFASRHLGPLRCISLFIEAPAASTFVGEDATQLTDATIAASDIWGPSWLQWEEQIRCANDDGDRARLLFNFLSKISRERDVTGRLNDAWALQDFASTSVTGAAQQMSMSPRQLQRRFSAQFGMSPKLFSRIMRVERTLRYALTTCHTGFDLALRHGYYDQSHMARDLRTLVGESVTELLKEVTLPRTAYWPLQLATPHTLIGASPPK